MVSPAQNDRVAVSVPIGVQFRAWADPLPATASWGELAADMHSGPANLPMLSPAERMVTACVLKGFSNKEIARALGKSECTVKNQMSAILRKLGVSTRGRLIALLR